MYTADPGTSYAPLKIVFGPQDVATKVKLFREQPFSQLDSSARTLKHNLRSPTGGIGAILLTSFEKGLAEEINARSLDYANRCELIGGLISATTIGSDQIEQQSTSYHRSLTDLVTILNQVSQNSPKDNDAQMFAVSQAGGQLTTYVANRYFGKKRDLGIFSLKHDISELCMSHSQEFSLKGIDLISEDVAHLKTPTDYAGLVVYNLIRNVLDHAYAQENDMQLREGTFQKRVKITGHILTQRAGKEIYCASVTDNGYGISPIILPRLFQQGATRKTDTSTDHGIGLWSIKQLVEQNGGAMYVDSKLGQGTKFEFTIPLAKNHLGQHIQAGMYVPTQEIKGQYRVQ